MGYRDVEYDPSGRIVPEWDLQAPDVARRHAVNCAEQLNNGVTVTSFVWEPDGLTISGQVDDLVNAETSVVIAGPDPAATEPVRYNPRVRAVTTDGQTLTAGEGVITVAVPA